MQTEKVKGEGRIFSSIAEALMAFDKHELDLQAEITIRLKNVYPPHEHDTPKGWSFGKPLTLKTTLGRALFNEALPDNYPFINSVVDKKRLGQIINDLTEKYPKIQVAQILDLLKELGFRWATRSGVTISIDDVVEPPTKETLLKKAEETAAKVQKNFERGMISDAERRQELIDI